jgi:hypothetical protein
MRRESRDRPSPTRLSGHRCGEPKQELVPAEVQVREVAVREAESEVRPDRGLEEDRTWCRS